MTGWHYIYWIVFGLMMIGLYTVISHGNLVKKLIGLNVFQVAVFLFFITAGRREEGSAPIIAENVETYSHPLPHVLILTAIVVGVATTSVGATLAIRVFESYGTIEEDNALQRDATDEGRS